MSDLISVLFMSFLCISVILRRIWSTFTSEACFLWKRNSDILWFSCRKRKKKLPFLRGNFSSV